jgi:molybdopterin synthase catalytic subunit
MGVRVQQEPLDAAAALEGFAAGRLDAGAVVTFTGLCRGDDEGRALAALTLEAYPEMAEAELARLVAEAEARWPLIETRVVHRYGRIEPGEPIVLVACASAHRRAAFEAAEFLMDYLKTRAPFWKSEETEAGERRWIEAKAEDDAAAQRW